MELQLLAGGGSGQFTCVLSHNSKGTSKVKRNMQSHLSAILTHESLGTMLQSLLPLIFLHFYCSLAFISAKYMTTAVPSEILLCLSDPQE